MGDISIHNPLPALSFSDLMKSEDCRFRLGHLRLFKEDLLECLTTEQDLLNVFSIVFGHSFKPNIELEKNGNSKNKLEDDKVRLWEAISHNDKYMSRFVQFACQKNVHLSQAVYAEIPEPALPFYATFFSDPKGLRMDSITESLELSSILRKLPKSDYSAVIRKVEEFIEVKKYNEGSCYLMRKLPTIKNVTGGETAWYFDFLNACLSDPCNCTIPKFIDPDFEKSLISFTLKTTKRPQVHVTDKKDDFASVELIDENMNNLRVCRKQDDYQGYRDRRLSRNELEMLPDPLDIELRLYQEELIANAEKGINTIICAPTGSGKTVVAAHIIKNHLGDLKQRNKVGRVAMLVPTVLLVDQQTKKLNEFMRKIYWVEGMSGSENAPADGRAVAVLASNIVVLTPQIFINLLKSVRKNDRLYFTDFTLFIFDECHHCDGDHPYNVLMRMLHEFSGPKPQIVGLTASLPLGSGKMNPELALDRMLQLCARLSVISITTVRKHKKDLTSYVVPPVDEFIRANISSSALTVALVRCMVEIEAYISPNLTKIDEMIFPSQQHSARYESFVGSLKARLNEMKNCKGKFMLIKPLEHLGYYYRALLLNDLLPDRYAHDYLSEKLRKEKIAEDDNVRTEWLMMLFEKHIGSKGFNRMSDTHGEEKDILKVLHELLREKYEREPDSRTIIFVTTRLLAEKLADHLNRAHILKKRCAVGYVTSSNQNSAVYGQTAEEQRKMIERFNDGRLKILVATSVAEEGLDISECNLIIKYNNTGSERSLIQRRGRARAKNSRSILLVLDGSVEERELENIQKELLMRQCLEHVQTKSEIQMKAMVDEKLEQERENRDSMRAQNKERRLMLANKSYNLMCRSCGAFICKSNDMRLACENQYVCCDPEIWKRVVVKVVKHTKSFDIATVVGKPHCMGHDDNDCNEELGTVVKLFGAFLPAISAKAIIFDDPDDLNHQKQRKWETIAKEKFFIDSLTERDLSLMLKSVGEEEFEQWEIEALLARQRAAKLMRKEKRKRYALED